MQTILTKYEVLQQYWGYDSFRPLQEEIIDAVLAKTDTLALMPTGGGKSICFQVPSLMQAGICLVLTPLIALMKDQVTKLKERGIPALAIYSGMHFKETEKILNNAVYGNFKFLYVSPERLQNNFFLEYLPHLPLNLLAVDEAHCISQWGYDFRPAYLKIAAIREEIPDIPLLALTATATRKVQEDIREKLLFRSKHILKTSFARKNISYSVFREESKINKLTDILEKVSGSSIVYCNNRRHTKEIANLLQAKNFSADYYHAGLDQTTRDNKQHDWMNNKTRIIFCTNAFGMGIDKPDVRTVIHYNMPEDPETYYQEAGRAGRDGKKAYAILLYQPQDIIDMQKRWEWKFPSLKEIQYVYHSIVNYLQLPAGAGEGQYHDFDLVDFSKTFQINIALVHAVVKILEQEEVVQLNESIFLPSRVMVKAGRETLYQFEQDFPSLDPLLKCLLRAYEGMLDNYIGISEKQMGKILQWHENDVSKGLQQLKQYGIIEYYPQTFTPQLYFLTNRPVAGDLKIDTQRLHQLKEAAKTRMDAMIAYVEENRCRSQQLLEYFDEPHSDTCGVCDVCLQKKQATLPVTDSAILIENIIMLLHQPADLKTLTEKLYPAKQLQVQEIIRFLLAEEKIVMNEKGEFFIRE